MGVTWARSCWAGPYYQEQSLSQESLAWVLGHSDNLTHTEGYHDLIYNPFSFSFFSDKVSCSSGWPLWNPYVAKDDLLVLLLPALQCWNCMPVLCDAKGWAQDFLCAKQVLYQWSCLSTLMKLIFFSHSQWVTLEDFWKSCSQFYLLTMNGLLVFTECLEWPCYFTTEPFKWCLFFFSLLHMWALLGLFCRWIKYMFTYAGCKEKRWALRSIQGLHSMTASLFYRY